MMTRPGRALILLVPVLAARLRGGVATHISLRADEPEAQKAKFDPTDQYAVCEIEGWKVFLNTKLENEKPELCGETLALLKVQLYQITRMVPPPAVEKLR